MVPALRQQSRRYAPLPPASRVEVEGRFLRRSLGWVCPQGTYGILVPPPARPSYSPTGLRYRLLRAQAAKKWRCSNRCGRFAFATSVGGPPRHSPINTPPQWGRFFLRCFGLFGNTESHLHQLNDLRRLSAVSTTEELDARRIFRLAAEDARLPILFALFLQEL